MSYADQDTIRAHLEKRSDGLYTPESERALVAAALCAPDACDDALERISPAQFAEPVLGRIWGALQALRKEGRAISPAFVRDRIGKDDTFTAWGGIAALEDLAETGSTHGLADHVKAVADRASRRSLQRLLADIQARVGDTAGADAASLITDLEQGAAEIARGTLIDDRWVTGAQMIERGIAYARARTGRIEFSYGIPELDAFTGGMNAGEVSLQAGRPGMGKTLALLTSARANAEAGLGTCLFSLEMSEEMMGLRLACDLAFDRYGSAYNPTVDKALKNTLNPDQWRELEAARETVKSWPLYIDARPGLTIAQIEAATLRRHRAFARRGIKPGPVIIDHLGKVKPSKDRGGSLRAETADVSRDISELAKRLNVPVLAGVQLNRTVEGRGEDKRPQLSDMREAGQLEEDARQVTFLFRPEYYLREPLETEDALTKSERLEKLAFVSHQLFFIVEKNSNGPRGQVKTFCDVASSAIRDWNT
jgi:replicative DNA helicase